MHEAVELEHEFEDSAARILVTSDQGYAVVEPIRPKTQLEGVVVTRYPDFLSKVPALHIPPSFLETGGPCAGTELTHGNIVSNCELMRCDRGKSLGRGAP